MWKSIGLVAALSLGVTGTNSALAQALGPGTTVPLTEKIWASVDGGYNSIGRPGLSLWSASLRLNFSF